MIDIAIPITCTMHMIFDRMVYIILLSFFKYYICFNFPFFLG